jgi:predicted NAD/FAD-dependent oxidoreductase
VLPPTEGRFAHRWRYARVDRPLGEEAWWDAARRIGACGDWCLDARVEAAFLSGRALAGRMLAR